MSEPRPSLYRLLTWSFLAGLIGVYALYHWYADALKAQIATQDAQIAQTARHLADTGQRLQAEIDTEQGLNAQIADLTARLKATQGEHQILTARHEAATAQVAALTAEATHSKQEIAAAAAREQELTAHIHSLGAQSEAVAKGLASKLDAARKAWTESEAEHQAARGHTKELEAEVSRLTKAVAAAEAKRDLQSKELEGKINERTRFFRTALEGSDPQRAAQIAGLEQQLAESRAALEQATAEHRVALEQAGKDARSALNETLAEAQRNADALTEQLTIARQTTAEHSRTLAAAKETHEAVLSESRGKVFALSEELASVRGELAALEKKHEQTVVELRTELDQAGQTLAGMRTEFSAAVAAAAQEKQVLEGQAAQAKGRIAALELDLETEQQRKSAEGAALPQPGKEAPVAVPQPQESGTPAGTQPQGLVDRYAQLHAQQTERGMMVSLADQELHFPSGGTNLPKGAIPSLDQIAALFKEFPSLTAVIDGHTDSSGPDAVNLTLSKARAEAVRQGLIARGVAPERLTTEGLGETRPIADNTTAPGRLKNRRVEVLVIEPAP